MPHAAGILFTYEQQDARAAATLIENLTGHNAEVIVSDDSTSHERLEEFKAGGPTAARWLVTCKMVSEGVDVRREIQRRAESLDCPESAACITAQNGGKHVVGATLHPKGWIRTPPDE